MKTVTRIRDRCGSVLIECHGSILEIKAGLLARRFSEPLDLCTDCGSLFANWLRSGRQTRQNGPGEALADTAVASMALTGPSVSRA
jgi:hypothetical protein